MLPIEHAANVIDHISHYIRVNNSKNTPFLNSTMKFETVLVIADESELATG